MILHANRFRFLLPVLFGSLIGYFIASMLLGDIVYMFPFSVGGVVGITIAAFLIPIKKINVILEEDRLRLPGKNLLVQPIEVSLSEIDLTKSRIGRFGEVISNGEEYVISVIYHPRKSIRNLFEELKKIKGPAL